MYNKLVAELVMGRICMGRVGYWPSLSWAEFVMGRDVQLPSLHTDCEDPDLSLCCCFFLIYSNTLEIFSFDSTILTNCFTIE